MRLPSKILPALLVALCVASGCSQSSASTRETSTTETAAQAAAADEAAIAVNAPSRNQPAEQPAQQTASTDATGAAEVPPAVFAEDAIAIRGADPVAYFTQDRYVAGTAEHTYDWAGATWQFATAENRDLFASNPTEYAPQYGGFCAWAVSQGYTASVDPNAWKIVDSKLYLNYDARVQRRWQRDIPGNIAKADQNWPGVLN